MTTVWATPYPLRAYAILTLGQGLVVAVVLRDTIGWAAAISSVLVTVLVLSGVRFVWLGLVVVFALSIPLDLATDERWWVITISAISLVLLLWPSTRRHFSKGSHHKEIPQGTRLDHPQR
jgi:hypothetical protein